MIAARAEGRVGKRSFGANTYTAVVRSSADGLTVVEVPRARWRFGQAAGCETSGRGACVGCTVVWLAWRGAQAAQDGVLQGDGWKFGMLDAGVNGGCGDGGRRSGSGSGNGD